MSDDHVVEHATCLGCGCSCDDIDVVVAAGRIVEARRACSLGAAWFGDGRVPARVRVGGRDRTLDEALDAAATLLTRARRPLVYLAPDLSCEAQREGAAIADALHAALDTVTSDTAMASILAAQERGRAGATLGELRNRADVVVFWGVDPALRYPRYQSRYAPDPVGVQVPDGRRGRTVIAADVGAARGPADADLRVTVPPDEEVATLQALQALAHTAIANAPRRYPEGEPLWARARELMARLVAARYVALVHDAEPAPGERGAWRPERAGAFIALAQALNGPTRCALATLRAGGNRVGADAVLTAQTGYPAAVDFARGFPRYAPHDGAGARLARGAVDAALVVGAATRLPSDLQAALAAVPSVVVGPWASEGQLAAAAVAVDTGVAGIHDGGTALRMDDVPLPLRPSVSGPPATAPVVRALADRVRRARPVSRRRPGTPSQAAGEGR